MKAFFVALAIFATPFVAAHYTFPDFIVGSTVSSDWEYIRETANHYSNAPVTDVTSPEFRCYELDLENTPGETGTVTVSAGSTVGFKGNSAIYHPGYLDVMMSEASPAANSPEAGTAQTWFKVYEQTPTFANGQLTFPSTSQTQFTFTIPQSLPSGQYLVRAEQIALHVASTFGGAQFYIGCAQINVVDGGSGNPSPLVSIPGVYTGYEPGILINIYNLPANFTGYQAPGPAIWQG
ncbi:glycoside hydrolase [Irpex rosettiformis]|uniref:Glycoside hydrolase n=1 Tax=Irpex rosettiformis TaxID=378272 RepID=A0ACB8U8F8_9APHY|nr:glycoside hydrolase [Irpex rosettiformis]